ncbi:threonine/serine exporter family protein [Paenibacillus hodogayensis]|uniref:Threonine/serine exporter family protein n=1 Tax=Paenibacillus hodogayensis TaxID=279208 RepID=A0ABV5W6T8_9BACL
MGIDQWVTSFIASAGFGILFNVPAKRLAHCGFVGMLGWMLYVLCGQAGLNAIGASLAAAFAVAVSSQLLAKLYKMPVIGFSAAGIIPLVPGGTAYDAMRNVVENHYDTALQLASEALLISGAIALGLVFSEVLNPFARRRLKL